MLYTDASEATVFTKTDRLPNIRYYKRWYPQVSRLNYIHRTQSNAFHPRNKEANETKRGKSDE